METRKNKVDSLIIATLLVTVLAFGVIASPVAYGDMIDPFFFLPACDEWTDANDFSLYLPFPDEPENSRYRRYERICEIAGLWEWTESMFVEVVPQA